MAVSRYRINLAWDASAPGWLAEVVEAGRVIDGAYFPTKAAARRWFRDNYSSVR